MQLPGVQPLQMQTIEADEDLIDIRALLLPIWQRKWLVLLTTVIGLALAVFLALSLEQRYTASARVLFEPERVRIIDLDTSWSARIRRRWGSRTRSRFWGQPKLLDRVIDTLRLRTRYPNSTPPFSRRLRLRLRAGRPQARASRADPEKLAQFSLAAPDRARRVERQRAGPSGCAPHTRRSWIEPGAQPGQEFAGHRDQLFVDGPGAGGDDREHGGRAVHRGAGGKETRNDRRCVGDAERPGPGSGKPARSGRRSRPRRAARVDARIRSTERRSSPSSSRR